MSFGIKNARTTYERLKDTVFSTQIKHNMKVYTNHMIIKTTREKTRCEDLNDIIIIEEKQYANYI